MKKSRFYLDAVLVGVLGVAVLGTTMALSRRAPDYAFFDPIIDVKHLIDTRFVGEVDGDELQRAAIDGMLGALNDPFSSYVPASAAAQFTRDLTGEYVGIGAQIMVRDGWLTIVSPLEDSPAYRAGVMADDRVVEIEGQSTFGKTADECVDLLLGEEGTPVELLIERAGDRFTIEIVREQIRTRSVRGVLRDPESPEAWNYFVDPERRIAYVRITQFTPGVADELKQALRQINATEGSLGGLILDVRNNPGGVLDEAVRVADLFLDGGVVVTTRGRAAGERAYSASASGTLPDFPLVVLINGASASASEVVAGALADHSRAIALGTRSFGKGSVQSVYALPTRSDGSRLKLTEQYYYLPSGRLLHRKDDSIVWGVDPTEGFFVPLTNEQTIEMFIARRDLDVIRAAEPDNGREVPQEPLAIAEQLKDPQLDAAIRALIARVDSGQWLATGEPGLTGAEQITEELVEARRARERMLRQLQGLERRIETLQAGASDPDAAVSADLWDDNIEIAGGRLEVFGPDGERIANLRITDNRLERWLIDAGVRPIDGDEEDSGEDAETPELQESTP